MKAEKVTKPLRKLLNLKPHYCGAVIVAGGSASRMQGIDKIMADLGGKSVIWHTVKAFQDCDSIREVVIVTREDLISPISSACREFSKVTAVVAGGDSRPASVHNGLNALSARVTLAAIHDGARPLVSWQLIDRVVRAAVSYGAAAPAIPVKDTIKLVRSGVVESTPDRGRLRAVQTPQIFGFDLLRAAYEKVEKENLIVTDDCSAVEALGMSVKIVEGEERNLKITTPLDLQIAKLILENPPE